MPSRSMPPCSCSPANPVVSALINDFWTNLPAGTTVSGISVGVINGVDDAGDAVVTKCYCGYANVASQTLISEDTVFEIGSVSKTFTTTMLAASVDAGTMVLENTAQSYYDQIESDVVLPVFTAGDGNKTQMTILDLADYTSGMVDKSPPNARTPNEYSVADMHYYLTHDFPDGLPREPGTVYRYVNTNFGILAELLLRLNGFPDYDDALQDLIAVGSLDMPNTGVVTSNTPSIPNLAQGYLNDGTIEKNFAMTTWPAFAGAGGIYSTLNDMLYWLQFNMGLTQSSYNNLLPMLHKRWFSVNADAGQGLGWFVGTWFGTTPAVDKNGDTSGFHSYIGFFPDSNIGVVVLCNTAMPAVPPHGSAIDNLGKAILQALNP
jgi:serine-type D-Ala-D-Ala carboxypeptidase/endopeptidase